MRNKAKALASAQKQLGRGNLDRAIKEYYVILKEDPKDLRVRQKIAELLARKGKIPEAVKEFSTVAEAYERGGFYPKAVAIYKQILRYEPKMMVWHLSLGEIYQQLAHTSDAMEHFNIVAQHYESEGSTRERIDIYRRLIRINPSMAEYSEKLSALLLKEADSIGAVEVWREFSAVADRRKDTDGKVLAYEKMNELRPEDTEIARKLADIYLDRGEATKALTKLQLCFRANPQDTETLNLLADAFVDLGEVAKATAVLKELAQIYESIGYESYRNQVYDRIAQLDPSAGESTGASLIAYSDADSAIEGLELGIPDTESSVITRSLLEASVFMDYGLPEKAQGCLEKLLAREPESYEARRQLLRVVVATEDDEGARGQITSLYEQAMNKSDHRAARACLARTTELFPEDDAARRRFEAFEEAMGDLDLSSDLSQDPALEAAGDGPTDRVPAESAGEGEGGIGDLLSQALDLDGEADDESEFDDFDFDDEEIAKLAAELEDDMSAERVAASAEPAAAEPAAAEPSAAEPASPEPAEEDDEAFELTIEVDDDDDSGDLGLDGQDFGFFDEDDSAESAPSTEAASSPLERGRTLFEEGDCEGAIEQLRAALLADDTSSAAMLLLGRSLCQTGDFRGAVEILKQVLSNQSADKDQLLAGMFYLAEAYEAAGNAEGAYKIYKRVVGQRSDFGDGEASNRLAALESQLGIN